MTLRAGGHEVTNGWVALRVLHDGRVATLRILAVDLEEWVAHLVAKGAVVAGA